MLAARYRRRLTIISNHASQRVTIPCCAGQALMKRSPVELRVGSTGVGVFVGCGAGLGIVTPIALQSIPVLGQLAASLSSSLGSLNAATGGVATAVRGRVRRLGVRNLDAGLGCGVMLGYGWGAGLFLSPTAQQSAAQSVQSAARQLLGRLPEPLQAAFHRQQQQQQHGMAAGTAGSAAAAHHLAGKLLPCFKDCGRDPLRQL
jgi:hypothetical protein